MHLVPGDPLYVLLGDTATPDQVDALRSKFGLDQPIIIQYFRWLANVARGDLGTSIFFQLRSCMSFATAPRPASCSPA
jgi:ABC-type dipeptide/oligopeptide/nickel transport systems, permease components